MDHQIEWFAQFLKEVVQQAGLADSAGESIEEQIVFSLLNMRLQLVFKDKDLVSAVL